MHSVRKLEKDISKQLFREEDEKAGTYVSFIYGGQWPESSDVHRPAEQMNKAYTCPSEHVSMCTWSAMLQTQRSYR